jgi:glycosyltransferase involved in cell wall biosynthesis
MRIGISTSVIQRGQTGIAQHVFALLRAMKPHCEQNQFVLFVMEEDTRQFGYLSDSMKLVTVPEEYRPPVRNILWHQTALPIMAREQRLDVLHIPSYRRLLWRRPCPLVGTIHDLAPFHVSGKYDWKRMFYGRVVAKRLARRQDQLIAISENTRHDLKTFFGISMERITVVYNGIDHERFFPGSKEQAQVLVKHHLGLNQPFFLYVARLEHPGKNHVRLIEAFDKFKMETGSDWQLVFAGSDWHGSEAIHSRIRKSPFGSDIQSLKFVPNEILPDLYRAAAVFVYPSLYEGFGLPPLEAMACGCPVISSTRGSLGEVLGKAAAIVQPEDVHSIYKELFNLATSEELRKQFRSAGLMQAQKFNWKRTAEQTLDVYRRATNGS